MARIGDILGRVGRHNVGQGIQLDPDALPKRVPITFKTFKGGLNLSDGPFDLGDGYSAELRDFAISDDDRLVPAKPMQTVFTSTRVPRWLFQRATLSGDTDLIALDEPWLGVRLGAAANFSWTNAGIGVGQDWAALSVGGYLYITDATSNQSWRIDAAGAALNVSANFAANAIALAFGRIFIGSYRNGANVEALGVKWNATTATLHDFAGTNAGGELLLSDTGEGDKIVAMHSIGFDVLGILNRKSLWAGYKTGIPKRPADFRPRFQGLGCVAQATVAATPGGVTFLSDDGVVNYNVNSAEVISGNINKRLLPIAYNDLYDYKAAYVVRNQEYWLTTPTNTWVYEFPTQTRPGRWRERSVVLNTIATVKETWTATGDVPHVIVGTKGAAVGAEVLNPAAYEDFGLGMGRLWQSHSPPMPGDTVKVAIHAIELEYSAVNTSIPSIWARDTDQNWGIYLARSVPATAGALRQKLFRSRWTGHGAAIQLQDSISAPTYQISRITLFVAPVGVERTGV